MQGSRFAKLKKDRRPRMKSYDGESLLDRAIDDIDTLHTVVPGQIIRIMIYSPGLLRTVADLIDEDYGDLLCTGSIVETNWRGMPLAMRRVVVCDGSGDPYEIVWDD